MNQASRFTTSQLFLALFFFSSAFFVTRQVFYPFRIIKISELNNFSKDEKRDIFSTFDTENQDDQGFPIDPFDLMNRLKQAGAMNNATTPSDALDEALNAFDESEY